MHRVDRGFFIVIVSVVLFLQVVESTEFLLAAISVLKRTGL